MRLDMPRGERQNWHSAFAIIGCLYQDSRTMAKILIVEDDPATANLISDCVASDKHTYEIVNSGKEALDRLKLYHFDLVVLDWQLPDIEGIEVLQSHRDRGGQTPILMLTGMSHIKDKETGFAAGADDYLTKPFYASELIARVKALLRRPSQIVSTKLTFGDISLDSSSHEVFKNGKKIDLLPKEFAVLELFMRNPNQVYSLEVILDRVWHSESETTPESVRTCMQRLRRKIDSEGKPSLIATVYGVGYKLDTEPT